MQRRLIGTFVVMCVEAYIGLQVPQLLILAIILGALYLLWTWEALPHFVAYFQEKDKAVTLGPLDSVSPDSSMVESTTRSMPTVVKSLQLYANGLANVNVVLWSNAHRPMADGIVSAFQLAGWEMNYNQTAQESHNPHYVSGIEVRGFNAQLVNIAAAAVVSLGGWDVRTTVDELKVKQNNPKWPRSQQTVYITVGYPKS